MFVGVVQCKHTTVTPKRRRKRERIKRRGGERNKYGGVGGKGGERGREKTDEERGDMKVDEEGRDKKMEEEEEE